MLEIFWIILSGQLVNLHKYKIQFSKWIDNGHKREIEEIIQMTYLSSICTYLGCSNIVRKKRRKGDFDEVKHRFLQKLVG